MEQLTFHREDDLDITDDPFKYEAIRLADRHEIEFTTELISFPFKTIVYEVTPHKNNNLARIWTDQDEKHHVLQLPAYAAINNRESGFLDVDAHLRTYAKVWATKQDVYHKEAARLSEDGDAVIRGTMNTLLEYSLGQAWKTGSAYIVGSDHLGIAPLPSTAKTLPGKIPLPRLIIAQFDTHMNKCLEQRLQRLFVANGSMFGMLPSMTPHIAHASFVSLGVLSRGGNIVIEDLHRRQMQGAPGSLESVFDNELLRSFNTLLGRFDWYLHLNKVAYDKIIEVSPQVREFHRFISDAEGVAHPGYLVLPTLENLCGEVCSTHDKMLGT